MNQAEGWVACLDGVTQRYGKISALEKVSLDIPATVITVQGAYPEIVALRPEFVQHLPTLDITKVDKLETYALAMFCAHADYKAAIEPSSSLIELNNSAVETRTILLADVKSLIAYGLLTPSVIDGLQGVNCYTKARVTHSTSQYRR